MKIALATCGNLPEWEQDDRSLHRALETAQITFDLIPWDAAGVRWSDYAACLIRTTWDYMERRDEFTAWIQEVSEKTQVLNPPEVLVWNTHKSYLRALEKEGVPIAPTEWLPQGQTARISNLMRDRGWSRGFLKPQVGATARETLRFNRDTVGAAQAHVERVLQTESLMLQPYLQSVEAEGEISLLFFDETLSHAVRKVPVEGDYRVQDDFGASDFAIEPPPSTLDIAQHALVTSRRLLGISEKLLYGRADFLRMDDGRYVINELELVEPSLFFRHSESAPHRLVDALRARL